MIMYSVSWLQSVECSIQSFKNDSGPVSIMLHWMRFMFLSPCPQRILFSAINLLFLFTILLFALQSLVNSMFRKKSDTSALNKPLLKTDGPIFRISIWFKVSVLVVALLALSYCILCVLALTQSVSSQWDLVDILFKFFQLLTNLVVLFLIAHAKKNGAVSHPLPLRIYWAANFILVCLFASAAVIRLVSTGKIPKMNIDDMFSIGSLPLYGFLLIVSIKGSSGIISPIIENVKQPEADSSNVSGYATASMFSKAVWNWMNPILRKGYKSPLKMEEVPLLPPDHQAERMAELFERNWPKEENLKKNPVRTLLFKCFWKDLAITGFLAVVRLTVMYVGPVLIQGFVSFSSGDRSNIYEGFYLILILLLAKVIEVLSSHHFNFLSQKLGMLIRSTLVTALYKKGLKLSCSSRQAHGVGQIVNYMAVDCQQLSDLAYQLHTLWMMPFQVGVALLILYSNIGAAVLVSLITVVAVMFVTLMITRMNNSFQYNLMMNRDSRMKTTTELLNNMRVIKFQAWEEYFREKIEKCREKEYSWLSKFTYTFSGNLVMLWSVPAGLTALTFGVATLMGVHLDAATVFTATSVFKILQEPIHNFPQTLISISQAIISLERLDGYLTSREIRYEETVVREENCGSFNNAVVVKMGTFGWDDDEDGENVLEDLSFEIKKGELAAIVGTVGSGKSSLLASVLGELPKSSGKVMVCGTTAYVAQTSWIQNATIQENILFGSPMDIEKYQNVVRVCCLEKDLVMMEHGDQTEIGERGINLSGGQKQRIQLARAVYQDRDIYLLDDIFSAVDAHTGTEIFKECIRGALKGKTILLVTHQVDFLHSADIILVLREGKIVQSGKYEELRASGLDFGALVDAHETSMELIETNSAVTDAKIAPNSPRSGSTKSEANVENVSSDQSKSSKDSSKLIQDEERESGRVSWNVYKQYSTEVFGWWGVVAVILTSMLWQLSQMASDYWLAYETSEDRIFVPSLFIGVFSIIAVISCLFVAVRSAFVAFMGLKTAQSYFKQIMDSILHAPMSFFDTTPSGRVLSRVSSDQVNVDLLIPLFLSIAIITYFSLLGIMIITCQYAWPTVFIIIPLIWLNLWYQDYYIASSRELTRLDQITKAPIIHHFSETISGVMTIRCFRNQDKFFQGNVDRVNSNVRMSFHNFASSEWLGFRLELMGSFFLCITTVFLILLPSNIIRPEYVGLSLSYGLSLNGILYFTFYLSSNLENKMVSVERLKQFMRIPSEAAWRKADSAPSNEWPSHGEIEIKDLQVRYRPHTPLVLKGISLTINGGEKIGVVGRTGSGKSTLIQVLFRLVEPHSGSITVDGVDISKLGLHDLRSRFGIIPQEPVLFEGTIRSNVDPLGLYSDDDIWKSLERCQLKDVVATKPEKLDAAVMDCGENWSVGQRQLLCLGRVILKRSRILFMDEATASVDAQTDAFIQKIIRQDFSNCTIITIAHRIPTVMDSDRVLAIDDGWAKEFDSPSNLLARKSLFGALVEEYANRSSGF